MSDRKPFTAEQARALLLPTPEDVAFAAMDEIRQAAEKQKTSIILRGPQWDRAGYDNAPGWREACDILRRSGFDVKFFYDDGGQFVDMGTRVSWEREE